MPPPTAALFPFSLRQAKDDSIAALFSGIEQLLLQSAFRVRPTSKNLC